MSDSLRQRIKDFKPSKGGKGSVCVIGGSFEYTGAPYFAAISALRTGLDLSFVICDKYSSSIIKSYSPELIVFGLLDREHPNLNLDIPPQITNRISAIIVGPGLSRNEIILDQVKRLLYKVKQRDLPIIFDGDGIFLFRSDFVRLSLHFNKIVLTPNLNEMKLLQDVMSETKPIFIYHKGEADNIYYENKIIEINEAGSPRRCGGIGDVLGGVISAIISMGGDTIDMPSHDILECLIFSGKIVRSASKHAFETKKRSMSALDVINNLSISFEQILE